MIGVIDYYEKPSKSYKTTYLPGQLYWAPIPFVLDKDPRRLRLDYYDAEKPHNANYTLLQTDITTFGPGQDPSLRHLGLASDEVLIATPHKKRPAIIISDPLTSPSDIVENYSGYLVVPCYSLRDEAGNYKRWVTREIVLRAKAYQLKSVFYLPPSKELNIEESFARLDRMQFIWIEHLLPIPVTLSKIATDLFREWAYHFLGAPIFNPALDKFIEEMGKQLDSIMGE